MFNSIFSEIPERWSNDDWDWLCGSVFSPHSVLHAELWFSILIFLKDVYVFSVLKYFIISLF